MTIITFSCFFVMKNIRRICFISTLSRCMVVIGLLLTLRIGVTQSVQKSQACYGSATTCATHSLHCQEDMIAIYEAYYTNNTSCSSFGLSACPPNFSSIKEEGRHYDLQATQLYYLYDNCSSKHSCNFRATRNISRTYSVIQYECIKHSFNMCNATHTQLKDVSILWEGRNEFSGSCKCALSAEQDGESEFSISALEFRIEKTQLPCSEIIINSNVDVLNCVSLIFPYWKFYSTLQSRNIDVTLNIREPNLSDRIWIRVKSRRNFSLNCQHVPSTSTVPGSSFSTGALVGSLVACALIIAGVAFVTVLCLRKRKKKKTKKGENTISAKVSKETFSSANDIPENLYFALEKPPPEPKAVQCDYTTADGLRIHNKDVNGEGDYDHIGDKQSTQTGDTAASVARKASHTIKGNTRVQDGDVYSYDHLNEATDRAIGDAADNDTTASSKKAVAKLKSKSNNVQEDGYGYNHLGSNHQVKTIQNDYDTTASAVKAVARLDETGAAEENDYDHVDGNVDYKAPASHYDTAGNVCDQRNDYNLAGTVTDIYQLAK